MQLLGVVPELIRFEPRNALVLVVFAGSRTCAAYRVDLPEPSSDTVYKRLATTLIGMLCRIRGADGVVPIVYTDDTFQECGGIPRETFATRFVSRARVGGFRVLDALCVAADGWGSYLAEDGGARHPLADVEAAVAARREAPDALPVLAAPERQTRLPRVGAVARERTARAYTQLARVTALDFCSGVGAGVEADVGSDAAPTDVDAGAFVDPVWFAETCLRWDSAALTPVQAALIAVAVRTPATRDIIMLSWAWGVDIGRRAAEFNKRWQAGEPVDPHDDVALALGGMGGLSAPDTARLDAAIELLRHVAARLPNSLRVPTLTMLAWLNWAVGRGSVAGRYVTRARRIDAAYGLAELLDELLGMGALPEWLYLRDAREVAAVSRAGYTRS